MMTVPVPESRMPDPVEEGFSAKDWAALVNAVRALESSTLAGAINRALGRRMKAATSIVPRRMASTVGKAVTIALRAALKTAIRSLGESGGEGNAHGAPSILAHRAAAAFSGAAGGAFGLATLPIELPISTTIMMRAIAEIARSEGEDLSDPAAALACLEVFALGGSPGEESWESGYFAVRSFLAKAVGSSTLYVAGRGIIEESAPALLRYLSLVGTRFGAAVTQKAAAQALPSSARRQARR